MSRKKHREGNWRTVQKLIRRDGLLCSICCYPMKRHADRSRHPEAITIDHRVPRSRGGNNHIDNLQLAHLKCNRSRGVEPWSGGPEAP